jgi:hypothetical protein
MRSESNPIVRRLRYRPRTTALCLGVVLVVLGSSGIFRGHHIIGETLGGFLGSFLLLTGLQVILWAVGIQLELFGTATDMGTGTAKSEGVQKSEFEDRYRYAECEIEDLRAERQNLMLKFEVTSARAKLEMETESLRAEQENLKLKIEIAQLQKEIEECRKKHM